MNPTPREEFSDVVRGVRRQLDALAAAGFTSLGIPSPVLSLAPSQPAPPEVPTPPSPSMTPVKRTSTSPRVPLEMNGDDPIRRSLVSERGATTRSVRERDAALAAIAERVSQCDLCGLCKGRTNAVPGEGSSKARVMFVGEGPGATEDEQGRPFVGRAGQLLTKIIESGMGLRREDVFIANIVKCRPPENRDPQPDEVAACVPYLFKQIEVVDPEVIIPLGRHSMRELAGVSERDTIGRVRGHVYRVAGRAVIPTYHPAYLLRNPPEKVKVWHDIQLAMKELGLPIPKKTAGSEGP